MHYVSNLVSFHHRDEFVVRLANNWNDDLLFTLFGRRVKILFDKLLSGSRALEQAERDFHGRSF
jgi:hypothetical protein